jgi:hypothetical protein
MPGVGVNLSSGGLQHMIFSSSRLIETQAYFHDGQHDMQDPEITSHVGVTSD